MSRPLLTASLLGLSFLGIADAWYLTQSAYAGASLSCSIEGLDGCNIVAQSAYSHVFGLPLALYGVFFYGLLFVLAALLVVTHKRLLYQVLMYMGLAGVGASLVFMGIQFMLIRAVCIYCLLSAVIALLIWTVTHRLWVRHAPPYLVHIS